MGQVLENGVLTTTPDGELQSDLGSAQRRMIRRAERQKQRVFETGVEFTGGGATKRYRVHADRTQILTALVSQISRGRGLPGGALTVPFEAIDGTIVPLSAAEIEGANGLADVYTAFVAAAELAPLTHTASINALTKVADVMAYDITTGWPA